MKRFLGLALMAALAAGCDAFKQNPSQPATSTGGTTTSPAAGGASTTPTAAPLAPSFTLSLTKPEGNPSSQTRFFSFASAAAADSGDFRFILPPGSLLQISTVGGSSSAGIVDLGAGSVNDANTTPGATNVTTMPVQDGHVYAIVSNIAPQYGKIRVTQQGSGTVTFDYVFPLNR